MASIQASSFPNWRVTEVRLATQTRQSLWAEVSTRPSGRPLAPSTGPSRHQDGQYPTLGSSLPLAQALSPASLYLVRLRAWTRAPWQTLPATWLKPATA
jgi:hypothetical protein